jgi:flavodoxin
MFEVIYYSKGGNTRKVAEVMAEELGTTAKNINSVETLARDATIFLGTGCYGGVMVKEISDFIERNQLQGRKIAFFTTSAFGWGKEVAVMTKHIQEKGVEIVGSFNCFGQFLTMKRGHPDQDDLEKARQFARSIIVQECPQIVGMEPLAASATAAR